MGSVSPLSHKSEGRMHLEARLTFNQQTITLLALVDSGADDCFIDSDVIAKAGISTLPRDTPITVHNLSGGGVC